MLRLTVISLILAVAVQSAQAANSGPAKATASPSPSPSGSPGSGDAATATPGSDEDFKQKLTESVQKTDKSIKIIREQITESQNAPFLPDLYVQLGDLLSQKSITLYYIKMEHDKGVSAGSPATKEFGPVVAAQKEAIDIYKLVLHDFPTYAKRSEVTYKLALSLKAIDEVPEFLKVASQLIKDFPGSQDAMRANLLLGRHFLDEHDFDEAYTFLKPIAETTYTYEKNLARYWIGLIYLGKDKNVEALHEFEMVVNDPDLKEQDNPYELKKSGTSKNDLKREALIDSIRAYTIVYDKNPDPVGYYSKLCPTEIYFQETMEKLALRYIFLKKYNEAVRLLRSTSERIADPQKIINVYREVLLMIPLQERISIPADEMRFVLQKFNMWESYYEVPLKQQSDSYWFFEKEVRDLGTRAHDLVRTERDPAKRSFYLERARDYYLLYLSYFDNTKNAVKIASDLADVYYLQGNFYESGDYYLRIFLGEFGKSNERKAIIENSILALQKDNSTTFYEKVRAKGLLIKAIKSYQAMIPSLKNDPKLSLLLLKTEYEQGFLPETLDALYAFMKQHGHEKQAVDAGELILDYFNTRNDFTGLGFWADRLLSLRLPQPLFNAKLRQVKLQAKNKVLQEKVKAVAGYDEFAEGKGYLTIAMNVGDAATKNAVLQEALAKSKRERDVDTFLQAAQLLADKEPNAQKKSEILLSIAQQNVKVGRYYAALNEYKRISGNASFDAKTRTDALEQTINTELLLHDIGSLLVSLRDPLFARVSDSTKNRIRELLSDALDSPIEAANDQVNSVFRLGLTEDTLLSLYKAHYKMPVASSARVTNELRARCGADSRQAGCRWLAFEGLEPEFNRTAQFLGSAPADLKSLESVATRYMAAVSKYQALESSTDSHLETALSLRERSLYLYFAAYLNRVANANPALRNDIIQKAREAQATAETYHQKCMMILSKATLLNPAMKFCSSVQIVPYRSLLIWTGANIASSPRSDLSSSKVTDLQRAIFAGGTDSDSLINLAHTYYEEKDYYQASALAAYGATTFADRQHDFQAILGCSVLRLGFLNEAGYHLKDATDYLTLKTQCAQQLRDMRTR
jgi:hypothetical protein